VSVRVYVEGGGEHNKALQTECRRAFSEFLQKAGLAGRMPKIVACGRRSSAYERFCTSQESSHTEHFPVLLVDSEDPVVEPIPWDHVRLRPGDRWSRPNGALDDQIHFMVQAMEAWFHADKESLQRFYGSLFRVAALSQRNGIENIAKADLFNGLQRATRDCPKGEYSKGEVSFQVLAQIDPAKVRKASSHTDRFLTVLDKVC